MSPNSVQENGAQNAFFYLTSFFALGFIAFGAGNILFSLVHFYFPESFSYSAGDVSQSAIKFGIASLLIASPVYFFTTKAISHSLLEKKLSYESGVRRWLTYLVLFITIATVLGDLVATLYSFLGGELTIRFLLKSLIILLIAGGIFGFYFWDIRTHDEHIRKSSEKLFTGIFWGIVAVPFFWSFVILENPQITRIKRIDEDTVSVLTSCQWNIDRYAENEKELPKSLDDLSSPQYDLKFSEIKEKDISYRPLSEREYELCASFQRDNREDATLMFDPSWKHPAGNFCFSFSVPKENVQKEIVPVSP